MNTRRSTAKAWLVALLVLGGGFVLRAETNNVSTNVPAATETNAPATNATATPAPKKDAAGKSAAPSGRLDYSSFRTIVERNIFNGNRSGQRMTSTRSSTQQRSVRVESFTLVGTLISERGSTAFFDGTSSDLRKTLKSGGSIAGYTVKEILHSGVRLAEGTNTLDVRVGSGMRREDEGLWKPSTGGSYASGSSYASNDRSRQDNNSGGRDSGRNNIRGSRNENNAPAASSTANSNTDVDAVLKRLMEQREKE